MWHDTKTGRLLLVSAVPLFISLVSAGLRYTASLQYDRSAIMAGEYWRMLTCHLAHSGWEHLFLNTIGVIILFSLFVHLYSLFIWLIAAVCSMIGISLSFMVFCPTLEWYNGLSGLLHALLLIGVIGELKKGNRVYYFVLLGLIGKLGMDYFFGSPDLTSRFTKTSVVTAAHLSGAIIGGVAGCVLLYLQNIQKSLPDRSISTAADSRYEAYSNDGHSRTN